MDELNKLTLQVYRENFDHIKQLRLGFGRLNDLAHRISSLTMKGRILSIIKLTHSQFKNPAENQTYIIHNIDSIGGEEGVAENILAELRGGGL